jgi:hypothetical protein
MNPEPRPDRLLHMINGPFIWSEKAAPLVVVRLMPFRTTFESLRRTWRLL